MKRTVKFLFILFSCVTLFSCQDYDDSFLKSEIEKIKADVESLKKQVSTMNTIVDALNTGKVITAVEKLDDSKGYKLTFNDATSIEVFNGEKAPVIGVKEYEGSYYWTITTDGVTDFLLDSNKNKLQVSGKDGETPAMAIDAEGYWTVNKVRIKDANGETVKAQGDSFFKEIKDTEDAVTFILADDSSIVLPKSKGTYLRFVSESGQPTFVFKAGQSQNLKIEISDNIRSVEIIKPEGWTTNLHRPSKYVQAVAPQEASYGTKEIRMQGIDENGLIFLAIAKVSVSGSNYSDLDAVFILNEGNMTTENGSLIFIAPNGEVYDNAYTNANGTELGNTTQDLFIKDEKMYIISQNGGISATGTNFENDGILVIANSKTLKKEISFNDELSTLSWPTHVAVLNDQSIFIRDNKGIHSFNSTSKELKLIEGTSGAKKNRMAVVNNKVFAISGSNLLVLEKDKPAVSQTISMGSAISGIEKSKDGHVWVATTGSPQKISKINSSDYSVIKANDITVGTLSGGVFATPAITTKGDTIYYGGGSLSIYRHIFSTGESKEMIDKATIKSLVPNANMVYNSMAVHPRTGKVYLNTIKGYGWNFLINNISIFDLDGTEPVLYKNYQDYTHFPAGIFFPANFQ